MNFCHYKKGVQNAISGFFLSLFLIVSIPSAAISQTTIPISAANRAALGIETESVLPSTAYARTTATGVVIAPAGSSFPITSPFSGVLVKPLVFSGANVSKGQEVALLHSPEYSTAKAQLGTLRLNMVHNQHLYESEEALYELGLRSELELDEAKHEMESARLEFLAMDERLSAVLPGNAPGNFVLTTSVDGVVSNFSTRQGLEVSIASPLLTVFSGSKYWASVQIPEVGAAQVSTGTEVQLSQTDTLGTVVSIEPEIDPVSRSLEVIVELPDDGQWRIGQLVSASFLSEVSPGTQALPERSIVRIAGNTFVFVEVPSGFRLTPVTIQTRSRNIVIVSGDLAAGDRVAISGLAALKNIIEGA